MKVVLLSGGGGGARFARGLADVLEPGELTIVGNVGDDVEILGLHVSPDLDSLVYTLGGLIDDERGWGRADETWNALESAASFGGEDWFRLGDRDIGLHLVRTRALRDGTPLSEITAEVRDTRGRRLTDPSGDRRSPAHARPHAVREVPVPGVVRRSPSSRRRGRAWSTRVQTRPTRLRESWLHSTQPTSILFAPSNPYLSIGPILAVAAIRDALERRRARCVAVSPLVGGAAVTGPAARMLTRMAGGATPRHVADRYRGLVDALVIDESDAPADADVELVVTNALMPDRDSRAPTRRDRPGRGVRVAIVGGTGPFGKALATRLHESGLDVVVGSRDAARAEATALELDCTGATNAEAGADADFIILAVNAEAALDTARELRRSIGSTPVLSVASELSFSKDGVFPTSEAVSLAERIQAEVDAPVVAGLHSLAASSLGADHPPDEDAFVCGDDADAKASALELAARLTSGRALDAGPLASARALEGLTAVIVNMNKRYKGHAGIRVTGLG